MTLIGWHSTMHDSDWLTQYNALVDTAQCMILIGWHNAILDPDWLILLQVWERRLRKHGRKHSWNCWTTLRSGSQGRSVCTASLIVWTSTECMLVMRRWIISVYKLMKRWILASDSDWLTQNYANLWLVVQGNVERSQLFDFARTSKFWEALIKKDVYADQEVLKLMTKTYDLSGNTCFWLVNAPHGLIMLSSDWSIIVRETQGTTKDIQTWYHQQVSQ